MTENTKTLSIRLFNEDKAVLSKYLNRESAEALVRQIKRGEINLTRKGVEIRRVNTSSKGANTTIQPISERNTAIDSVNTISVNTCEECPYSNDLNMDEFDDICKLRGIDRQKALDKCVQMLWR